VRKIEGQSTVVSHATNPVRTSYDLLWEEVRHPTQSSVTIQNTLRRILENYFTILGSVDAVDIIDLFEGRDRDICRSLFSWVHAGSHYAFDDLYVAVTDGVDNYLRVFRQIFEKSKQLGHYRMMMGDAYQVSSKSG
jgi:wobble nucleotide-excising tRNase